MIKRIITFFIIITLLFTVSYSFHNYFNNSQLSFSLFSVYLFHAISSLIVYLVVELMLLKLPNQAGYAYLMLIFFKIGIFVLIYQSSVFGKVSLSKPDKLGLVIPLFLFLLAEATAIGKQLNSK